MMLEGNVRIPWTTRKKNKPVLEHIKPETALQVEVAKLKLSYTVHITRRQRSLENTIPLGKIEGHRERGGEL